MSQNFKTALKYWFWLLVGILLISIQVYKYYANTLEMSTQEGVILFVGLMFMIKPTAIPDTILKIFGKK
ncbi:hypothetical protein ACM55G_14765 [Flavobacterium sp. LB3P122]|uniref:hypothetical protein n=1 Tax=Flavobacterium algoriphilum TaxID=3398738 RepID=UPI003A8B22B4